MSSKDISVAYVNIMPNLNAFASGMYKAHAASIAAAEALHRTAIVTDRTTTSHRLRHHRHETNERSRMHAMYDRRRRARGRRRRG